MRKNEIVKSQANIFVYILFAVLAVAAVMLLWYTTKSVISGRYRNSINDIVLLFLTPPITYFVFIHPFFTWYRITITETEIIYRWRFNPFRSLLVPLADIDGFHTMDVESRESSYLTYIPVAYGRPLPLISSFYFDNSKDLIKATGAKNLGSIPYSLKRYFTITLLGKLR